MGRRHPFVPVEHHRSLPSASFEKPVLDIVDAHLRRLSTAPTELVKFVDKLRERCDSAIGRLAPPCACGAPSCDRCHS